MADLSHELDVARTAAIAASVHIMSIYASDFQVDWKAERDPVTAADRGANAIILKALQQAFPNDAVCAEESSDEDARAASSRGGRCWFVDPLDGTREFVSRNGEFAVMIGLALDNQPVLGVVYAPALRVMWWGAQSMGAFVRRDDNEPVPMLTHASSSPLRCVVSRSNLSARVKQVLSHLEPVQMVPTGSVGIKTGLVLENKADLYLHTGRGPKLWDACAPDAIARAASTSFTNERGQAITYVTSNLHVADGMICAAPELHSRVLEVLRI